MSQPDADAQRTEDLRMVAKTLQECQRILDHHKLTDVAATLDATIFALQRHVEFQHSPPDELLKFFGLDDLKNADAWWRKDPKT